MVKRNGRLGRLGRLGVWVFFRRLQHCFFFFFFPPGAVVPASVVFMVRGN